MKEQKPSVRWLFTVLVVSILLTCLVGLVLLGIYARRDITELATARSDNVEWVLSQGEVELLELRLLLEEQRDATDPDLGAIRRQFDIFYSRAAPLFTAPAYSDLLDYNTAGEDTSRLLNYMDDMVVLIDGDDARLIESFPQMIVETDRAIDVFHNVSLEGVKLFSLQTTQTRARAVSSLLRLAILTSGLIVLLLLGLLALSYVVRLNQSETRRRADAFSRMDAVVSTAFDGIIVVDSDGKIIEFNPMAEKIFGYDRDEVMGGDLERFVYFNAHRKIHEKGLHRYKESGATKVIGRGRVRVSGRHKDGYEIPLEISVSTARYNDSEVFVGYMTDITQDLANERELIVARDQAIAGEKAKANLLAVMSHEIRTPLNGIVGAMDLLRRTKLTADQKDYLQIMQRSGDVLMRHVDDVLDISRLDAGSFKFANESFSPALMIKNIVEEQSAFAKGKNTKLIAKAKIPDEMEFIGDPLRIKQVLNNLVSNAIKFTKKGEVLILTHFEEDEKQVCFDVIDCGAGIPEEQLESIFKDFVTLDASYMRSSEGTGLGLGIAKRIVEGMGGQIGVASKIDKGSRFWVKLPCKVANSDSAIARKTNQAQLEFPSANLDVLIVEDNKTNRFILRQMLEKYGNNVYEAENGREGIDMAAAHKFDVIFMDISMPEIDGVEATQRIKATDGPNVDTPIIAVTAHALPEEIRYFQESGMRQVVTKPITMEKISNIIDEYAKV